jgi:hypothetical protein
MCVLLLLIPQALSGQKGTEQSGSHAAKDAAVHPLNEVVAVVNQQVVLASDVDEEMRLVHLLPGGDSQENTAPEALERLITRLLIEQQIRIEDPSQLDPDAKAVNESLIGLRQDLPGCKLTDCMTDAGWTAFLAGLDLTPDQVAAYWKDRYAVLGFIEQRFRSGIRISPEEINSYYQKTLLPLYRSPAEAPSLKTVSSRIQEVLLQQRVNRMLDDWVKSLREQGQVEIVDPTLRAGVKQAEATSTGKTKATRGTKGNDGVSVP